MIRLIEKGLMFGNLFAVDSPALVERYNRALGHLTARQTTLSDFHIDISGYSPEIGDEFDDQLYLNQNGVNRQFILLSTEQKSCPLLHVKFSTSRAILKQFITTNEAQLFALTAGDAVAGELINSVFTASDPKRLFDMRRVRIEADTTTGTLRFAEQLGGLVDRFQSEEDAWFDDALISRMIALAKKSGDLTRNPIRLKHTTFSQGNFWTALFGGVYLFQKLDKPALLSVGDPARLAGLPVGNVIAMSERNKIAKFLARNHLAEPIVRARGIDGTALIRQKMDFLVIDAGADAGDELSGLTRTDMRRLARQNAERLLPEYTGLAALLNWAEGGGDWPRIDSMHPAYFYTLRARDGDDAELVNMLLAELTPRDFRQLFICHKELFYALYARWPDSKKAYVADFLAREYLLDKVGAREALFGHEPAMEAPPPPRPRPDDLISRVGPWGAVRRKQ